MRIRINAFGIRGPEIKDKSLARVLFVGDSFVEADEVAFDSTFGQLLNRHFYSRLEFLSHGVGGWSPTTEFSWIYHKGLELDPDEVVIFLFINDFFRNHVDYMVDQTYRREATWKDGIPVAYSVDEDWAGARSWRQLLKKIQLIRIPYYAIMGLRSRIGRLAGEVTPLILEHMLLADSAHYWPESLRQNVDSVIGVLFRLDVYLKARNVRLSVGMIPAGFAWRDEVVHVKRSRGYNQTPDFIVSQAGLEAYLATRLRALDIRWLNPRAYFDSAKKVSGQLLFNEADGHLNVEGHRVLFEYLRDQFDTATGRPPYRSWRPE